MYTLEDLQSMKLSQLCNYFENFLDLHVSYICSWSIEELISDLNSYYS